MSSQKIIFVGANGAEYLRVNHGTPEILTGGGPS